MTRNDFGSHFEALIHQHLLALAQLSVPRASVFSWRTQGNDEVDFVVEHGRDVVAIEVKLSQRVSFADAQGLTAFMTAYPKAKAGLLLYAGNETRVLGDRMVALPWQRIVAG
jgi:uncharacterized protein